MIKISIYILYTCKLYIRKVYIKLTFALQLWMINCRYIIVFFSLVCVLSSIPTCVCKLISPESWSSICFTDTETCNPGVFACCCCCCCQAKGFKLIQVCTRTSVESTKSLICKNLWMWTTRRTLSPSVLHKLDFVWKEDWTAYFLLWSGTFFFYL